MDSCYRGPVADAIVGREVLHQQYGDTTRLSARQALWQHRSGPSLLDTVLDRAALRGQEFIVDVGCGNGAYLVLLRERGHRGRLLGLDLSEGMARAAGSIAPTVVADAQALPLADGTVDVALSMHMLYHVPDIAEAIAELRRVVHPAGRVLVATNGSGHTAEISVLLTEAIRQVTGTDVDLDWATRRFNTEVAHERLAAVFDRVDVQVLGGSATVRDPAVLSRYLASLPPELVGLSQGPQWSEILAAADRLIEQHFAERDSFTVSSRAAVILAR
jgi:SAM-dependent methyltransferase